MPTKAKVLPYVKVLEHVYFHIERQHQIFTCHALSNIVTDPFAPADEKEAADNLLTFIADMLGSRKYSLERWLEYEYGIQAMNAPAQTRRAYRLSWIRSLIKGFKEDACQTAREGCDEIC